MHVAIPDTTDSSVHAAADVSSDVAADVAVATSATPVLPSSAFELHRRLTGLQRLEDRVRFEFLRVLGALDAGRGYQELGYVDTKAYLMREYGISRSHALELVRVARKLDEIPTLAGALEQGEIHWSDLRVASRVATAETDGAWLGYVKAHSFEQLQREVKCALLEGRDRPTEDSAYGLANLRTRVYLEMTLEEKERFQTAMANVAASMGASMGAGVETAPTACAPVDLASAVLFVSEQILQGQTVYTGDGKPARSVLYQQCPDCAVSTVDTLDGPVRVEPEVVAHAAGVAQCTTITPEELADLELLPPGEVDAPNTPTLTRKVLCRDGYRCGNPGCERRDGLQAHHIHFRSKGGRTTLSNEVTVCRSCHTLIHAGLLRIDRTPEGQLSWIPRLHDVGRLPAFDPFPELEELLEKQPELQAKAQTPRQERTLVDVEALVPGLVNLGFGTKVARERLERARAELEDTEGGSYDEEALLRTALRMR